MPNFSNAQLTSFVSPPAHSLAAGAAANQTQALAALAAEFQTLDVVSITSEEPLPPGTSRERAIAVHNDLRHPAVTAIRVDGMVPSKVIDISKLLDAAPETRSGPVALTHRKAHEAEARTAATARAASFDTRDDLFVANRTASRGNRTPNTKSPSKYDGDNVALVDRQGLEQRWAKYDRNTVLPMFVHRFLTDSTDSKSVAFVEHPEQFPATSYSETLGGIVLMPNRRYIPGELEAFPSPSTLNDATRHDNGFVLVGYWVPGSIYEGQQQLHDVFKTGKTVDPTQAMQRPTIGEFKANTGLPYITTTTDVKPAHLPMLREFKNIALANLRDVYGVDEARDDVKFYMHSPVYGDETAGLHIHVRVNHVLPAGEWDLSLRLDDLIAILETPGIADDDVKEKILEQHLHTRSGKYFTYSPTFDATQFSGIDFSMHTNVWQRPKP
ncbi:hypothetical protein [Pandoraea fibrosis]|uniref:Uncharacterized protein n=1 Tax=Pandoraea fibrosis TaxID=1891094 RepID=A0A5E4YIC7_9BURK|nr:hypothetical protein [Pandoraea fibrosis]VVE48471.1 hypothetical protein PFI31113_04516 [Pandoraea fibrosis]